MTSEPFSFSCLVATSSLGHTHCGAPDGGNGGCSATISLGLGRLRHGPWRLLMALLGRGPIATRAFYGDDFLASRWRILGSTSHAVVVFDGVIKQLATSFLPSALARQ